MVEIHSIMDAGKNTAEFLVYGVGLGYIARRFIGEWIVNEGTRVITKTERNNAIWSHYQHQASGLGHESASPVDCTEGKCKVFGASTIMA